MTRKNIFNVKTSMIAACLTSALAGGSVVYFSTSYLRDATTSASDEHGDDSHANEREGVEHGNGEETLVELPAEMWDAANIEIQPVARRSINRQTWATGKITLNEDRTAHIYSITEGLAHEVPIKLGDRVEEGQTLAIIDSREVGAAKLDLYQARLQESLARKANDFAQQVKSNALQLIRSLDQGASPEQIRNSLGDKPIGKYRAQLLGAYATLIQAKANYERLMPIAESGAIAGKQMIEAEANYNSAQATFDAIIEQLRFAVPQDALETEQALQQATQAIEVAKAKLEILGYSDSELSDVRPSQTGEHMSHYEVIAPFGGTIIAKNTVFAERVGTDTEMFRLADLSTVWVQADIYQKDLPAIAKLGESLTFRAPTAVDGDMHTHTATIFYRGDVLDPETRTLRLRAVAENEDRHLKPGMFVEIEIPAQDVLDVLAIPESAVQTIEDRKLVFVQESKTQFRPVPIVAGEASDGVVQIRSGLNPGDKVVVSGAFALKSEMMKGAIGHGH